MSNFTQCEPSALQKSKTDLESLEQFPKFSNCLSSFSHPKHVNYNDLLGSTLDYDPSSSHQLISIKEIPFFSLCEHHLSPFFGHALLTYIPNKKLVALGRIHDYFSIRARQLTLQEKLTELFCQELKDFLKPKALYVRTVANHTCSAFALKSILPTQLTYESFSGDSDYFAQLKQEAYVQ